MPTPTARPKAPRVRHILEIGDALYLVRPVPCDGSFGRRAFRVAKAGGPTYDLIDTPRGAECDCPDFVFRRDGLDPEGCKHVRALAAVGLLRPTPFAGPLGPPSQAVAAAGRPPGPALPGT